MAANTEIYVGEEGAKELYRRLKALIPDVPVSSDSWKQWSILNGSTGDADSIFIGGNNEVHGPSIEFGYENYTASSESNAIMLGRGNESLSTMGAIREGAYEYQTFSGSTPYDMDQADYGALHDIIADAYDDVEAETAEAGITFCRTLLNWVSDYNLDRALTWLESGDEESVEDAWYIIEDVYWDVFLEFVPGETECPIYAPEDVFGFYSLLAGVNNQSNHYNSILIGTDNTSLAADEHPDTDDDGFLLAVGYNNTVGRNYDIAIGHRSYAVGGENLSIHQSMTTGYRNIAMVNSGIYGIANMALMESTLWTEMYEQDEASPYLSRNVLIASKVGYDNDVQKDYPEQGAFTDNIFTHSALRLNLNEDGSMSGFSRNVFMMNSPFQNYYYDEQPLIETGTATNNIVFNLKTMYDNVSRVYINKSFDRNTMLNTHIEGKYFDYVTDNTFVGSEIEIFGYGQHGEYDTNTLSNNLALDSLIYASFSDCVFKTTCNVVTQNSFLHVAAGYNYETESGDIFDNYMSSTMNTLMNGAYLKCSGNGSVLSDNNDPYWGYGWDYFANIKNNVLFGAFGEGLLGCFSHSENDNPVNGVWDPINGVWDNDPREYIPQILEFMSTDYYSDFDVDLRNAWMVNSRATVNFGDNFIGNANTSFVIGEGNIVCGVNFANIHGNRNLVNNGDGECDLMPHLTIDGHENKVFNAWGWDSAYFHDNSIKGHHNCLYGNSIMDSSIIGSENDISGFDLPILTVARIREIQENFARSPGHTDYPRYFIAKDTGYIHLYDSNNDEPPLIEWRVFTGKVYKFIAAEFGLAQNYINAIPALTYGYSDVEKDVDEDRYEAAVGDYLNAYFAVTEDGDDWNEYGYVDNLPNYCSPDKSYNYDRFMLMDNVHIIGRHNHIGAWHVGDFVVGQNNSILTTEHDNYSAFCYSNSFVQGSNNFALDGSNQVLMGNGIVSTGHNSVAIGSQLISNQWQTVIGKYNQPIAGPNRTAEYYYQANAYVTGDIVLKNGKFYEAQDNIAKNTQWADSDWAEVPSPDRNAALFIIGNGYGEYDNWQWQDEEYIHRSNAFEVYADGTVKARRFVSSEDEATLTEGDGIKIVEDAVNGEVTISIKPPADETRRHMLEWDPVNRTVRWVEVGMYSPA